MIHSIGYAIYMIQSNLLIFTIIIAIRTTAIGPTPADTNSQSIPPSVLLVDGVVIKEASYIFA